jgi:hypothetical protein
MSSGSGWHEMRCTNSEFMYRISCAAAAGHSGTITPLLRGLLYRVPLSRIAPTGARLPAVPAHEPAPFNEPRKENPDARPAHPRASTTLGCSLRHAPRASFVSRPAMPEQEEPDD